MNRVLLQPIGNQPGIEGGYDMLLANSVHPDEFGLWEMESDLPSLACQAAIELDNLVIGRPVQLEAVRRLAAHISPPISGASSPDLTTLMVIRHAIDDGDGMCTPLSTVDQLRQEASKIGESLHNLLATDRHDPETLKKMRTFCLVLSRSASAYQQPIDDIKPRNPFRK